MNKLDVKWISSTLRIIGLALAVLLSGCSSMPEAIQYENPQEISVQAVHRGITNIAGQTVRWGGVITQVINNEQGTWVEVLALNLNDSGKPSSNRLNNEGRFIAKVDQFLDPEVYQQGYSFTVVGTLADKIDGKIGKFKYSYPTVNAQGHYLWPKFSRNTHHYVMPGYWYYGFHSYWHFGYNYYGYGVRYRHGFYYPYYPFYGHMTRRVRQLAPETRDVLFTRNDNLWNFNTQRLTRVAREARAQTGRAEHNVNDRTQNNRTQNGSNATRTSSATPTPRHSRATRSNNRNNSSRRTNRPTKIANKEIQ